MSSAGLAVFFGIFFGFRAESATLCGPSLESAFHGGVPEMPGAWSRDPDLVRFVARELRINSFWNTEVIVVVGAKNISNVLAGLQRVQRFAGAFGFFADTARRLHEGMIRAESVDQMVIDVAGNHVAYGFKTGYRYGPFLVGYRVDLDGRPWNNLD